MNQHLTGLPAWLVQRLSAVFMAVVVPVVLLGWWLAPPLDFPAWRGLFTHPVVTIVCAMFFLALLLHAWVGVRDVIIDYAGRYPAIRLVLLMLLGGWLIALGFWVLTILIMGLVG